MEAFCAEAENIVNCRKKRREENLLDATNLYQYPKWKAQADSQVTGIPKAPSRRNGKYKGGLIC